MPLMITMTRECSFPPFSYMGEIKKQKQSLKRRELPFEKDTDLSLDLKQGSICVKYPSDSEVSAILSSQPDHAAVEGKMTDL